ncbi:MAG: FAD-binding oxidoreductase [Candidatus Wallbacteria bacterium]|nr:FAD-binding oxidoreductase [Candidatus Wallbacteria bacterium]
MKYDAIIIGGGIIGASIAYNLTKQGMRSVAVFEKNYISSGSTGRCGGGIRQQWASPENCKLAVKSVHLFEKLDQELGFDTEYYQGGYLLLAFTDEEVEQFRKNVVMQQGAGVPVRLIGVDEVAAKFPFLDTSDLKAAAHCRTDGHINPMLVNQAYADAAKRNGADIHLFTEVVRIVRDRDRINSVITADVRTFETGVLINAGGGFSAEVAAMAGITIPTRPQRHEILITEPLEKFMDPMVIDFHHHIYFRQTKHGSVVMGYGDPHEPYTHNIQGSLEFLKTMSLMITKVVPAMKKVKIVRQWAGLYNMSPDAQPILGKVPGVSNYYQAVGFSGHGLMLAPAVAELMAELIVTGRTSMDISDLSIDRFAGRTEFKLEKAVV